MQRVPRGATEFKNRQLVPRAKPCDPSRRTTAVNRRNVIDPRFEGLFRRPTGCRLELRRDPDGRGRPPRKSGSLTFSCSQPSDTKNVLVFIEVGDVFADEIVVPRSFAVSAVALSLAVACRGGEDLPGWRASWVRVATADFELYTTADENSGRSLIFRLEKLRAVLRPILDWRNEPRNTQRYERPRPICIIEFASRDEFLRFAPISRSIGFFLPGAHRDFVVLDGTYAEGRAAAHEYVHFVMAQSGLRLPTWLNEGLAELYSNLEEGRSDQRTAVGQFIPGRVLSLRRDAWIGLAELTSASADSGIFTGLCRKLATGPHAGPGPAIFWQISPSVWRAPDHRNSRGVSSGVWSIERSSGAGPQGIPRSGPGECALTRRAPSPTTLPFTVERDADFEGLTALAEMLANYRGRTEQSRDLYRQLEREYSQRVP
jgi:hypothetical protein